MTDAKLLALLSKAKQEGWTRLDLSGLYLTELPTELAELNQLEELHLGWNNKTKRLNYLRELPDWMSQFTNLRILHLSSNRLKKLPGWMSQLTNLQALYLSSTDLSELPEWMSHLTRLRILHLSSNGLSELPNWIIQMSELQSLSLGANSLSHLPPSMAQLTNLQKINLSTNKIDESTPWMPQFTALRFLDLSSNNLRKLPDAMAEFINLQTLDLRSNSLSELPDFMAKFTNLQTLDLRINKLNVLPDWMSQLTNLQTLDLSYNELYRLPEQLAPLVNLQFLSFKSNNLSELPSWMAQLTSLRSLHLSSNNISEFPDWVEKLINLQTLDLSWNNLSKLPPWLANNQSLPSLRSLYIKSNPIIVPPAEVLGDALIRENTSADIEAIRNYFRQLQRSTEVYSYEAKLLIIGEGGAGKTSLARKLLEPECALLSEEESTEGIDILPWHLDLPLGAHKSDRYTVNIWDFGGQEIYFATHQFFLTKRSLYVLVADTRRQHTDFYTWLLMQETFGDDSPVLLVKNLNRTVGQSFHIENLPHLQERFPNLREIIELDLDQVPGHGGWTDLLHHVQERLLALPHIGQPNPGTWVRVREAIDADERDVITWAEFVAICQAQGMEREGDMAQLADYLHNLGDILHFGDDPVLRDTVILRPTWGLDAVYAVLDNEEVLAQQGEFSFDDLRSLWNRPEYGGYHLHLLHLMQNFQLCYELPDQRYQYIAPQLLDDTAPKYEWDEGDNLQLRYVYPVFMPRGILSRAIVKLHRRIEAQERVWRSGVILCDEYARAEVLELRGERQIRIRVSGRLKGDLLMEIDRALHELHRGFPKLRYERQVPCICKTCLQLLAQQQDPTFYDLAHLRQRLADGKETIECRNRPYTNVRIRSMLSEVVRWKESEERGGNFYYAEHMHWGDNHGDYTSTGDITNSGGTALGRGASGTVQRGDREGRRSAR